jgi:hypothetical protein
LVSWISKKQSSISLSTAEAEYIAATTCCTKVLWMKQTLTDIQVEYDEPIPIYCDNTSVISISKNPVMHSKLKHISIKYHFLREQVTEKNIRVEYVGTKEQVVDIFTKPLPREALDIFAKDLKLFLLKNECLSYMSYMYMRKHHTRKVQSGGEAPDGKIPFPLMTKGERFIRCRGQRHGSRGNRFIRYRGKRKFIRYKGQRHGSRGSMSDTISILH